MTARHVFAPPPNLRSMRTKVPQITAAFWITKVLTTGMGETLSDYLATTFDPVLAVAASALFFAVILTLQFRAAGYVPWLYWLTVVMVSVFGTMVADVLHVIIGVPYVLSTIAFAVVLTAVFVIWHRVEGTLSIHDIRSGRREFFYWSAVLSTFALGTAAGDLTAQVLGLGYLGSGILFALLIAVPAVAFRRFRLGAVGAFWFAYVVTRPLGASFADWMAVSPARGGLGWGTGPVSLALGAVILGFVVWLALSRRDADVALPADLAEPGIAAPDLAVPDLAAGSLHADPAHTDPAREVTR